MCIPQFFAVSPLFSAPPSIFFAFSPLQSRADVMSSYLRGTKQDLLSLKEIPPMEEIFRRYNVLLPSSAPVERLFSQAGIILRPHRRRLGDKRFENLLLLKMNGFV